MKLDIPISIYIPLFAIGDIHSSKTTAVYFFSSRALYILVILKANEQFPILLKGVRTSVSAKVTEQYN